MARSDPTNRPRPTTRRGALTWLGASALPRWAHAQSDGTRPRYTVSVVPQFAASELHRDWAPLLERLSQESRLSLTLRVVETISRFEAEFLAGVPDFVYLNPYHQVMARRAQGYVPLVRDGKPLSGILVVRRDSALRSVTELAGKPVAFPSPNAFGASLWIRALLAERDRVTIEPHYAQTHSNVYRQVLLGRVAAGGGVEPAHREASGVGGRCLARRGKAGAGGHRDREQGEDQAPAPDARATAPRVRGGPLRARH